MRKIRLKCEICGKDIGWIRPDMSVVKRRCGEHSSVNSSYEFETRNMISKLGEYIGLSWDGKKWVRKKEA